MFLLDAHLGRLARSLRLFGFDSVWEAQLDDDALSRRAIQEDRILLSCDRALILNRHSGKGYLLRGEPTKRQLEVLFRRYDLGRFAQPFSRCMSCNGTIAAVSVAEAADLVDPAIAAEYEEFFRCLRCGQLYWKGSHYRAMKRFVETAMAEWVPSKEGRGIES